MGNCPSRMIEIGVDLESFLRSQLFCLLLFCPHRFATPLSLRRQPTPRNLRSTAIHNETTHRFPTTLFRRCRCGGVVDAGVDRLACDRVAVSVRWAGRRGVGCRFGVLFDPGVSAETDGVLPCDHVSDPLDRHPRRPGDRLLCSGHADLDLVPRDGKINSQERVRFQFELAIDRLAVRPAILFSNLLEPR